MRVLIVDDEVQILRSLKAILELEDVSVLVASSAVEGLELVKSDNDIGLVVSDVRMPKYDGLWLLKQIKQYNEKVDVLLMSGFSEVTIETAKEKGAITIFKKPEELRKIVSFVTNAVKA